MKISSTGSNCRVLTIDAAETSFLRRDSTDPCHHPQCWLSGLWQPVLDGRWTRHYLCCKLSWPLAPYSPFAGEHGQGRRANHHNWKSGSQVSVSHFRIFPIRQSSSGLRGFMLDTLGEQTQQTAIDPDRTFLVPMTPETHARGPSTTRDTRPSSPTPPASTPSPGAPGAPQPTARAGAAGTAGTAPRSCSWS